MSHARLDRYAAARGHARRALFALRHRPLRHFRHYAPGQPRPWRPDRARRVPDACGIDRWRPYRSRLRRGGAADVRRRLRAAIRAAQSRAWPQYPAAVADHIRIVNHRAERAARNVLSRYPPPQCRSARKRFAAAGWRHSGRADAADLSGCGGRRHRAPQWGILPDRTWTRLPRHVRRCRDRAAHGHQQQIDLCE